MSVDKPRQAIKSPSSPGPLVLVDSTQCHLWTDALHVRQLAHDTPNRWDRGTYVRLPDGQAKITYIGRNDVDVSVESIRNPKAFPLMAKP